MDKNLKLFEAAAQRVEAEMRAIKNLKLRGTGSRTAEQGEVEVSRPAISPCGYL